MVQRKTQQFGPSKLLPPHPATVMQQRGAPGFTKVLPPHPATLIQRSAKPLPPDTKSPALVLPTVPFAERDDDLNTDRWSTVANAGDLGTLEDLEGFDDIDDDVAPRLIDYDDAFQLDYDIPMSHLCVVRDEVAVFLTEYTIPEMDRLVVTAKECPRGAIARLGSTGFDPCLALCALGRTSIGLDVRGMFHWPEGSVNDSVRWPMVELTKAMKASGAVDPISYFVLNPSERWPRGFDDVIREWEAVTVTGVVAGRLGAMEVYFTPDGRIEYTFRSWT